MYLLAEGKHVLLMTGNLFLERNVAVYPQTQPRTPEEHSLRQLYHIAVLITEAISFILYLLDSDVSKVVSR